MRRTAAIAQRVVLKADFQAAAMEEPKTASKATRSRDVRIVKEGNRTTRDGGPPRPLPQWRRVFAAPTVVAMSGD